MAPHLVAMAEMVTAAIEDRSRPRLLFFEMPPRHGKSEFVCRYLPAWYLGSRPRNRVILASYGAELARTWGRRARDVLQRCQADSPPWFGGGANISGNQSAAADWETVSGGGMVTAGAGGPITGRGANLLIVDDPIKNAEEAMSDTMREALYDWWRSTASTRLEPDGIAVVMATRWHKDDLTGRLIGDCIEAGTPFSRLCLPAIAEENDPLGRNIGDPLWPRRWPASELEAKRTSLGSYWWNALYQQRPTQHANADFPARCFGDAIWPAIWPDTFDGVMVALDASKGKNDKHGDFSAAVAVGVKQGRLWVDAFVRRVPPADAVAATIELAVKYRALGVAVEINQFQELLLPEFQRQCEARGIPPLPVVGINNSLNKALRIRRLGPYLERGEFRFRPESGDVRRLVQQLQEFPLADHDDGPDALEMACRLWSEWSAGHAENNRIAGVYT